MRPAPPEFYAMPYVRRDPFVLKLWTLGFVFITETSLAHVFKRGDHRIVIPKVDHLDEDWAREQLRRCAISDEKVLEVLAAA
jgi:hypothetical protein